MIKPICMQCTELATVNITYGLYDEFKKGRPHYDLNLCEKHSLLLWDKSKDLVTVQLLHWVNKNI